MSSFPRLHKLRLKRHLPANQARRSTAIRVRIMPSLGMVGHITTLRLQHSPTSGHTPFSIANCDDLLSLHPFRATGAPSASGSHGAEGGVTLWPQHESQMGSRLCEPQLPQRALVEVS